MSENIIVLPDRTDRFGSNYIAKLCCYILAKTFKAKLYHKTSIKYSETIFTKLLLQNSETNDNDNIKTFIPILETKYSDDNNKDIFNTIITSTGKENWLYNLRGRMGMLVQEFQTDIFTYFGKHHKTHLYNNLKSFATEKLYSLPYTDPENVICIHLRCDDKANSKDYDGDKGAQYVKQLIESNSIHKYNAKEIHKVSKDKQTLISPWKFGQLVKQLKEKYPKKRLYVVSAPNIPAKHKKIIKDNKIKRVSNPDYELDLWVLIHSHTLVLSKSTYSMVAALFHQGSQVIYPEWGMTASAGLGTKYDQTGWKSYI